MSFEIKKIAVLGAGTMGPGIAQTFAMGGCDIVMWTRSEATREKALASLKKNLQVFAEEDMLEGKTAEEILSHISFAPTVAEAVAGADMVMETIVEKKDAKAELYAQLAEILPSNVILASNTSALNIFEFMPEKLLPQVVIAHWYSPPQLIPLVEVVKSESAPQEMADAVVALLEKCGKTAVLMNKFIQGYIVNRLQQCLNREVFFLLDNGYCTPEDIDRAAKASFIPRAMVLGLCKRADFGGLDMTANNYRNHSYTMPEHGDEMPHVLEEHVEKGELGIKTGKGFYDYTGIDMTELLAKRDHQLFEAFRLEKELMEDPV